MIQILAYSLQAFIVIALSRGVFLALKDLDYFRPTPDGPSDEEIATALQVQYTGLHQLVCGARPLLHTSHVFTFGSFGTKSLVGVIRHSPLDGAAALVDDLEALRTEAQATGQQLRKFQLKVDEFADRYDHPLFSGIIGLTYQKRLRH
jgi:hypothetical protein